MSKLGDIVLTEKTSIKVTIATFFMMMVTIIGGAVFVANWTSDIDHRLSTVEKRVGSFDALQIDVIEMKTDLKWIRAYMERDK